jgi:hypothetical protein
MGQDISESRAVHEKLSTYIMSLSYIILPTDEMDYQVRNNPSNCAMSSAIAWHSNCPKYASSLPATSQEAPL